MRIRDVLCAAGATGFFFDDQAVVKQGAIQDGFNYVGSPVTTGFTQIRQPGEAISVMLVLEDGRVAYGDCAAVQYSGTCGRDPLLLAESYIPFLNQHVKPLLVGAELTSFRDLAARIDSMEVGGRPIHTALRYGLSQAILEAVALTHNSLMSEVICREYDLPVVLERIPIMAQSGDDRYLAVDKMILKRVDALPHALMNHIESKVGRRGEMLADYLAWLVDRIEHLRPDPAYKPDLHVDVYGIVGAIFDNDPKRIAEYLQCLEIETAGYTLWIEGPVDMGEKQRQIEVMAAITAELDRRDCHVKLVADEWCNTYEDVKDFADAQCCHMLQIKTPDLGSLHNTVESVLYCKAHGIAAYQGGTCNETDLSARACVQVALAARPDRLLAKPGMGFDEGYLIANNEMQRTLAILAARTQVAA